MDIFSLEDDDCPELFITQSGSTDDANDSISRNKCSILGDSSDFSSPSVSILNSRYSDISDDEDLVFPLSQKHGHEENTNERYGRLIGH